MTSYFRRQRGSTVLLIAMMLPLVLIPIVGLAIDGTVLYLVQAKLSSAVDGAALGAGRLLGTNANTTEIAGEFLSANFPSSYWGATNLQPTVTATTTFSTHTITVNATVDVPLYFMRLFGGSKSTIAASAVSQRRDSRVELILDRSASMSGNIGSLRTAATTFVNRFTPGVDELGLVVFGGSAFVAYPTTKTLSTTGPSIHYADTPGSGQDNMLTMISALASGSDTGTAEGLYLAWQELRKANALDADPTRLNAIVLFTDGVPNGITAYFNDRTGSANALKSTSQCTYNPSTGTANQIKGWYASTCSGSCSGLQFFNPTKSLGTAVYTPINLDTSHTAKYWASNTNDLVNITGTPVSGCTHLNDTDLADLKKIPDTDLYGNSTSSAAITQSLLYSTYSTPYDATKPGNGYHAALASWAAVDNMAQRILADTTMSTAIYCIGYTGNGGVDTALLKRIANTLDSGAHNASWQTGIYVPAADSVALTNAFNTVASEILRLAK